MKTSDFPIDDTLIPRIIQSSKVHLNYRVMGKLLAIKKMVQLLFLDVYVEYKNDWM